MREGEIVLRSRRTSNGCKKQFKWGGFSVQFVDISLTGVVMNSSATAFSAVVQLLQHKLGMMSAGDLKVQ